MRETWNEYFLNIAHVVSSRSTCDRLHVGCVLTRDKRIVATGYNGSLPGRVHCDDVGHDLVDGHCVRTQHAEKNLLMECARFGISTNGASIFITHSPCFYCFKDLVSAGISVIYYKELYRWNSKIDEYLHFKDSHYTEIGTIHLK